MNCFEGLIQLTIAYAVIRLSFFEHIGFTLTDEAPVIYFSVLSWYKSDWIACKLKLDI